MYGPVQVLGDVAAALRELLERADAHARGPRSQRQIGSGVPQ